MAESVSKSLHAFFRLRQEEELQGEATVFGFAVLLRWERDTKIWKIKLWVQLCVTRFLRGNNEHKALLAGGSIVGRFVGSPSRGGDFDFANVFGTLVNLFVALCFMSLSPIRFTSSWCTVLEAFGVDGDLPEIESTVYYEMQLVFFGALVDLEPRLARISLVWYKHVDT